MHPEPAGSEVVHSNPGGRVDLQRYAAPSRHCTTDRQKKASNALVSNWFESVNRDDVSAAGGGGHLNCLKRTLERINRSDLDMKKTISLGLAAIAGITFLTTAEPMRAADPIRTPPTRVFTNANGEVGSDTAIKRCRLTRNRRVFHQRQWRSGAVNRPTRGAKLVLVRAAFTNASGEVESSTEAHKKCPLVPVRSRVPRESVAKWGSSIEARKKCRFVQVRSRVRMPVARWESSISPQEVPVSPGPSRVFTNASGEVESSIEAPQEVPVGPGPSEPRLQEANAKAGEVILGGPQDIPSMTRAGRFFTNASEKWEPFGHRSDPQPCTWPQQHNARRISPNTSTQESSVQPNSLRFKLSDDALTPGTISG